MHYLITGGAGFIGSHLVDAVAADGHGVIVLDDLGTGSYENIQDRVDAGEVEFVHGSTSDADLVAELMAQVDRCYHLASAVGVQLICDHPLDSLLRNVHGAENVIRAASERGVRLLFTSTSEIYGKNSNGALSEESERVLGSLTKSRWCYALAKSFGEVLSYEFARAHGAETIVVRLFNTVGPRQVGRYGMVLPTFVNQALLGQDLTVYGDGSQSRCFCHVDDVIEAMVGVMDEGRALGGVFNIGSDDSITITQLAERVIERLNSDSQLRYVAYEDAYADGFEELGSRRPDVGAINDLLGWRAGRTVDDMIADTAAHQRALLTDSVAQVG